MIYEYRNKYYIKLYPSVYREIKVNLVNDQMVIESDGVNTEINNESLLKQVSPSDIESKLHNKETLKNKKSYK